MIIIINEGINISSIDHVRDYYVCCIRSSSRVSRCREWYWWEQMVTKRNSWWLLAPWKRCQSRITYSWSHPNPSSNLMSREMFGAQWESLSYTFVSMSSASRRVNTPLMLSQRCCIVSIHSYTTRERSKTHARNDWDTFVDWLSADEFTWLSRYL